jgi:uncharacterized protein YfdQ (DUF2303 family)
MKQPQHHWLRREPKDRYMRHVLSSNTIATLGMGIAQRYVLSCGHTAYGTVLRSISGHGADHKATHVPEKSVEWATWISKAGFGNAMGQMEFAAFLEENLKDITATDDGMPSGSAMLQMALDFEAKQDMRFKSAVRLQSGGVRMEYVADEDKNTVESMKVFERFQIAVPVLRDDTSRYPITARLRYRQRDGKLAFWYELIRADLVMEHSARALVENIRTRAGLPFFFGSPFAK